MAVPEFFMHSLYYVNVLWITHWNSLNIYWNYKLMMWADFKKQKEKEKTCINKTRLFKTLVPQKEMSFQKTALHWNYEAQICCPWIFFFFKYTHSSDMSNLHNLKKIQTQLSAVLAVQKMWPLTRRDMHHGSACLSRAKQETHAHTKKCQ